MGHIENDESNSSSIVACVFIAAVTFLPSHCVATTGIFTKLLHSNYKGDTHLDTQSDRRDLRSFAAFPVSVRKLSCSEC
jgi:hypothetical protein